METAKQEREVESANLPHVGRLRRPRKRYLILGAIALAVALGASGYAWATHGKESTDDAQVEADVVPISARVAGQVKRVAVPDDAQAGYDVARAALVQAQANLDLAQSHIGEAQGKLSQSSPVEAAVAAAEA